MPIITITIDDTHESYALYGELICRYGTDATDFDLNGHQPDFSDEPTSDTYVEADPTPPHGTPRPRSSTLTSPRLVDCPHPGCPGRPGDWCGSPLTKVAYGPHFFHAARKQARNVAL